jgi:type IV secretory pathway TraG/TraD family ATPase VirD4
MPDKAESDNAKFFRDNGRKILTASLIAFYGERMDFIEICEKIVGSSWQDLFRAIDGTENEDAIMYINSFMGASEVNTSGCKESCDSAIKLFSTNAKIKRSIHRPIKKEITIQPKMIEKYNIFVIVDDPKLNLYSPLLNIITSQQMQYISNRQVTDKSQNILLFLDEYASLKLEANTILEALRKYRKRKCRVMLMTQNLADLDILYGKETTRAIMANLRFKVLLGGLGETESQKYFAELIGYKNTTRHSKSSNANTTTHTQSEAKEYVIEPAELDRQGKDTVILIHPENKGYMILKKNYYFKSTKGA